MYPFRKGRYFSIFVVFLYYFCTGQTYLQRVGLAMKRLVIFASGSGSNAQQIIEYFAHTGIARVVKIFSNRPDAYVLQRAKNFDIPTVIFDKADFYENESIRRQLQLLQPDLIVLAGFLWRVPENIIQAFPKQIINIHPALLPDYGGKGMYGNRVHQAIIGNHEKESGITIHYVNENYDEGAVILQARCRIESGETPETLAEKVHSLEYKYYPRAIEQLLIQS